MVKRKITEGQKTQWPKEKSQKVRQHNGQKTNHRRSDNTMVKRQITEGQTTQWSKAVNHTRSDNTMAKRQITEGQTTQWPKEKSQKVRKHNG